MIYPIVMYGDPVLRQKAKDIEPGTDLSVLIEDMFETMHAANGVGLAAPQIGKSLRLFVVDGRSIEDEASMESFKKVFVNPQMVEELGSAWEYEEGSQHPRKSCAERTLGHKIFRRKLESVRTNI